ncbi:MAG: hypothetical protein DWQ35_13930 [Planctomycetota bacterium]|nr:MAG: hypothetical protein DWQ35_13930 [Planctomycetota bacterium]REK25957.1 MAG: hypothetical protein DWQ42_10025 [Planctomycetota bacterium]REK46927.1 MAG: hypothetical protein DWQ46_05375 [Planctomycetota bacterium]
MLTELYGKGGRVCGPAREGQVQCPLIVRPTSEDAITGNIFGTLAAIDPRWWLPQILNAAIGTGLFRQRAFRRLRVELWKNYPPYPRELLPWSEGSTQVDVVITWENPPTTVFVEAKYLAPLAARTEGGRQQSEFPSDQVIRNIRVGLLQCGWFGRGRMFAPSPRRFVVVVLDPVHGHDLVKRYRSTRRLLAAIPHSRKLAGLPETPLVGDLNYRNLASVLRSTRRFMTRSERLLAEFLCDYLDFKARGANKSSPSRQRSFVPAE